MRKRVIGIFIAVALVAGSLFKLMPVGAETVGPLDHVVISLASATVAVGGTQQFAAQGQDASNNAIDGLTYTWTIVASGGTVDISGLFTAGSTTGAYANTVQVSTTQGAITKTATASVTVVTPGPLDHVIISPASASVVAGGTQQFTAQGQDVSNVTIPGLVYTWSVVAADGTINGTGLFTAGLITGVYANTVQASTIQGTVTKTGTASVTVTVAPGPLDHVVISPVRATLAIGGAKQFTAQAKDAANVTIPGLTYTWSVVAVGGTISTAGLFTAGTTAGSYANTVQVSVTQGAVTKTATASVTVTSQSGQGKQRQLGEGKTPPGWEKGQKKGWNDGSVPPGWDKGKKAGSQNNGHDQEQEQEDD